MCGSNLSGLATILTEVFLDAFYYDVLWRFLIPWTFIFLVLIYKKANFRKLDATSQIPRVISFVLDPNLLLRILFWDTCNLHTSLRVISDPVSIKTM
jgi:hypothetical protein